MRCALGGKLDWATFAGAAGLLLVFCCCCLAAAGWLLLLLAVGCCWFAAGWLLLLLLADCCRCCCFAAWLLLVLLLAACCCLSLPLLRPGLQGLLICCLSLSCTPYDYSRLLPLQTGHWKRESLVAGLFGETRCPMRKQVSQERCRDLVAAWCPSF